MPVSLVRMPSLDLVKGFVAVGRRMSISLAAEDLCVTQSAISKQVRALEDALGVRLLQRGHRKVAFTAEGERFFRVAESSVQQLQDVLGTFGHCTRRPVTLTASMGVAGLWLLPRIAQLRRLHPDIELRVTASNNVLDLTADNIDLAIRYCPEAQAPRGAHWMFGETLVPVMSPALGAPRWPWGAWLREQVLLEVDDKRPWLQWTDWLAPHGLHPSEARGILRFNLYDQLIHAAVAGQGIALGRVELLQAMFDDGRLVAAAPPDTAQTSPCGFWLVQADPRPRSEVACVIDWLTAGADGAEVPLAEAVA